LILFFGNFLSKHGLNPTAIEDLVVTLGEKYDVIYASSKKNVILRFFDMVFTLFINRKRTRLIFVDVFSTKAFFFSLAIAFCAILFKISFIPIFRGGYLIERFEKYKLIFRYFFTKAELVICPSVLFYDYFGKKGFNVKLIPNYIDIKKYKYKLRMDINPKILWVRSIHTIYNPKLAIELIVRLIKKYPAAKLCFVGPVKDSNLFQELNYLVNEYKLQKCVSFKGYLSKNEWSKLSESYDIFLNTTNYDNNPITLLEAMALGLPVISTKVGGISQLIEDQVSGLLVEANDLNTMEQVFLNLLNNKYNIKKISSNALKIAQSSEKSIIIKEWYQIIDEFL